MNEMFVPFDFLPERPIVGNEMDRYVLKRFPFNIFIAKPILKRTLLKKLPTLLLPNRIKKWLRFYAIPCFYGMLRTC